jgi:hypothetical protein
VGLKPLVCGDSEIAAADKLAKERRVVHDRATDNRRRRAGNCAKGAEPVDKGRADFGLGRIRVAHVKAYLGLNLMATAAMWRR